MTKRHLRFTALAVLLAGTSATARASSLSIKVVSFTGELKILSGNSIVVLRPGSPGFSLSPGSDITILGGEALLSAESAMVKADQDDRFIFLTGDGLPLLSVQAGRVEITLDGVTRSYGPGQSASLEPAAPSVPPPAPTEAPVAEIPIPARPSVALPVPPQEDSSSRLKVQIELHPSGSIRQTYDSNIYLVPPDKPNGEIVGGGVVGAWITTANMGLKVKAPLSRRHFLEADYGASLVKYSKQAGANDSANQSVSGAYNFEGRAFSARAFDAYTNTEDPAFSELVTRERRWQNTAGASALLKAGRSLVYGLDGQHTVHKYLSPTLGGFLNRYEQTFGGSFGVELQPKTKVFAAYHRNIIHYSATRAANSKGHTLDLGIDGDITALLHGKVSGGIHYRKYDNPAGSVTQELVTWKTGVDLKYRLARRTELTLAAFRSVSEATFGTNRFSLSNGANFGIRHSLRKVQLGADAGITIDRYPESTTAGGISANRRDDTYSWGANTQYKVREWLSAGLFFNRMQRNSIFSRQFNYEVNRTSLEFKVTF